MMAFVRIAPPWESAQAALFIRDRTATVTRFGRTPGIAGRFKGIDWQRRVLVVALVLKVRTPDEPVLYELIMNLHDPEVTTAPFAHLASQPKLIIQFFGDEGNPMTACMLNNPFTDFARVVLKQLEQYPAWSEEQFSQAATDLKQRHPTPKNLWEALSHATPSNPPPATSSS